MNVDGMCQILHNDLFWKAFRVESSAQVFLYTPTEKLGTDDSIEKLGFPFHTVVGFLPEQLQTVACSYTITDSPETSALLPKVPISKVPR